MKRIKNIIEFEELLQDHDWYYALSDDKKYYTNHKMIEQQIVQISQKNTYWRDLFLLYSEFSSPSQRMSEEDFVAKRSALMENYLASLGN